MAVHSKWTVVLTWKVSALGLAIGLASIALPTTLARGTDSDPSTIEMMSEIRRELEGCPKKYMRLADSMTASVLSALEKTPWSPSPKKSTANGDATSQSLEDHDYLLQLDRLIQEAIEDKPDRDTLKNRKKLRESYQWEPETSLSMGLRKGIGEADLSPDDSAGFVPLNTFESLAKIKSLEDVPDPWIDSVGTLTRVYSFGLDQIVDTRFGVKQPRLTYEKFRRTKRKFEAKNHIEVKTGINKKKLKKHIDALPLDLNFPPAESIRCLLEGTLPNVEALAIPYVMKQLHSRLRERRRQDNGGEQAALDSHFAVLDGSPQGYFFLNPHSGRFESRLVPTTAVMADNVLSQGFLNRFSRSQEIETWFLPMMSIYIRSHHAKLVMGKNLSPSDFSCGDPCDDVKIADREFELHNRYVVAYRHLIEFMARVLLRPHDPMPGAMTAIGIDQDRFRHRALLVWGWAEEDPVRVADWLYDEFLSRDRYAFGKFGQYLVPALQTVLEERPSTGSLTREKAMLEAIAAKSGEESPEQGSSVFRAKFGRGQSVAELAHAYERFHAPLREAILELSRAELPAAR